MASALDQFSARWAGLFALIFSLLALGWSATPAGAAYTSSLTGSSATMNGSSSSDYLFITSPAGSIEHNRFSGGDADFASDFDFDTTVGGVQGLAGGPSAALTALGNDGNDGLNLGYGSDFVFNMNALISWNGGNGSNTLWLDDTQDTTGRSVTYSGTTVSYLYPGPVINYLNVSDVTLMSGSGNDTISVSGASTLSLVSGGAGNDMVTLGNGTLNGIVAPLNANGYTGTDSLKLDDSAETSPQTITITDTQVFRTSTALIYPADFESSEIDEGSGSDLIVKSASLPYTINAGGGDDRVFSADGVADTINCGAGNNTVYPDGSDTVSSNCQTVVVPGSGGTTTTTPGTTSPSSTDTTPPVVTVSGLPAKTKISKLSKGLTFSVQTNEVASVEAEERATAKQVKLSVANLTLGSAKLGSGSGTRKLTLRANKRLLRGARRAKVEVRVVATDLAGNRTTVTRSLKARK